jgi:hypothetical protein
MLDRSVKLTAVCGFRVLGDNHNEDAENVTHQFMKFSRPGDQEPEFSCTSGDDDNDDDDTDDGNLI